MILVTGGTGLVGAHLLLKLLQKGHPVRAIHRKSSNLEHVQKVFGYYGEQPKSLFDQIEWVEADIIDIPALEVAFKGVDRVYHAAALISFDPDEHDILQKINAEGTANVVNLCITNQVKKLCYVSTIGAIGKTFDGSMATEETPWTPQEANVYGLSKYAAELEVWRGSQEGLPVAIINPGVIVGPGFWDSGSGALFTVAKKAYNFYPPGGTGFIAVQDVVDMMVQLMESPIKNERFIAVAENWNYKKILTLISRELGIKSPTKKLKFWQLEVGRWIDWTTNLLFKNGRKITKSHIRALKNQQQFDNRKIRDALGFEFTDLEKEIRFCCAKFMEERF